MLFSTLKKNIEKCPFTYWLNGRWFLQIVERDSWNLYPLYPLFPCSDFVSQMWGWFGGGGCNVFLTFYAISSISRKNNLPIQTNYLSFNVFFMFFFVCWKYWKVPLHLQLLAKWEVVSPNTVVDIGHFIMRLKYDKKCGVSFWTCSREISGDRVALLYLFYEGYRQWHKESIKTWYMRGWMGGPKFGIQLKKVMLIRDSVSEISP